MRRLCEAPKTGSGSGVTPEGTDARLRSRRWSTRSRRSAGCGTPRTSTCKAITQAQIDRRLTRNFDKTYPVDFYERRSQAWGTIGVIPAGASIRDALLAFQTGQVVGFYNPANKQLVYIGDTDLSLTERFILAHELTHAIDDQHFGLGRLDSIAAKCDDEAFTAGLGAIEGSAQFFATQVILRFPSDAPDRRRWRRRVARGCAAVHLGPAALAVRRGHGVHHGPRRPRGDRARGQGADHVPGLVRADHPSRAVAGRLAAARGRAGPGTGARGRLARSRRDDGRGGVAPAACWSCGWTTSVADRAAAGWDGGIYRAWTDGTQTAVVLRTVWDTPQDAQEFADAMSGWIGDTAFVLPPMASTSTWASRAMRRRSMRCAAPSDRGQATGSIRRPA